MILWIVLAMMSDAGGFSASHGELPSGFVASVGVLPQSPTIPHLPPPKPQPQVSTDARPVLLVTMSPSYCPPCEDFKRQDWSSSPFQVKPGPHHKPLHYPWIEWQGLDGKWWYLPQWSGKSALIETWERTQSKPVASAEDNPLAGNYPRYGVNGDYAAHVRWHGIDTNGLTFQELEQAHAAVHAGVSVKRINDYIARERVRQGR